MAIRSVGQIYSDCLDSATIERRGVAPLVEAIQKSLGDWPMLQRKHTENNNTTRVLNWQNLYVSAYAHTGIVAAFNLSTLFNFDLGKSIAYVRDICELLRRKMFKKNYSFFSSFLLGHIRRHQQCSYQRLSKRKDPSRRVPSLPSPAADHLFRHSRG